MITDVISQIVTGLGALVPGFFGALLDGFTELFIVTTESTTKLTPVGEIAIVFIVLGICYKIMPTVLGWLRLYASKRRARKSKKS